MKFIVNMFHMAQFTWLNAWDKMRGIPNTIDEIRYQERLSWCNIPCSERTDYLFCKQCNCYTPLKARYRREKCPKGYW